MFRGLRDLRDFWSLDAWIVSGVLPSAQKKKKKRALCHSTDWCLPLCLTRRESCHAGSRSDPSISLTRIQGGRRCYLTVRKHLYKCAMRFCLGFLEWGQPSCNLMLLITACRIDNQSLKIFTLQKFGLRLKWIVYLLCGFSLVAVISISRFMHGHIPTNAPDLADNKSFRI